jgi:hypothetical protein
MFEYMEIYGIWRAKTQIIEPCYLNKTVSSLNTESLGWDIRMLNAFQGLPSMHEALSSIPSIRQKEKKKTICL